MSNIIVIHGPMGSGKSTISAKLNEVLPKYVLVDRAYIKDTMLKSVKKENPAVAKKLSADAVFLICTGLLEEGYNLILQEFRASSIKKRFGTTNKVISFYLDCTLEEAQKRDTARQNKYVRPEVVEAMHQKHGHPDKEDIVINTESNSVDNSINIILNHINES